MEGHPIDSVCDCNQCELRTVFFESFSVDDLRDRPEKRKVQHESDGKNGCCVQQDHPGRPRDQEKKHPWQSGLYFTEILQGYLWGMQV